ncbi:non-homologous end joining protein Ku [Gluconacetobacter takamatsuzukensis]|uniref:Non-homologous end joining protein Ku n=1 Tax=Gluconacetobacter takamatsuzukensis TaxID=1286190 RepID=A0A7W4PU22_9PROT|nr:Ku protein [Gluconacetobacter takamatsuzukensis]MBB2206591.1 Ku protein [Gluconacetobacter takamatsuzukensis]
MAARASWKGTLTIGKLACPVALFAAVSTSERIALHLVNRATGNRVHRHYVDSETGDEVARDDQVKGYETKNGDTVLLDPEEIAAAVPDSDKNLAVSAFIRCGEVDDVYLDRPYYLGPAEPAAEEAFALIREGLAQRKVVALARTVLFRRVRTLLIRAHEGTLIATTLNFDDEVRASQDAFRDIPDHPLPQEMLDLAAHIIETKRGHFDPSAFEDWYEAALAALVEAKLKGKAPVPPPHPAESKVVNLMDALRQSAGASSRPPGRKKPRSRARPTGESRRAS